MSSELTAQDRANLGTFVGRYALTHVRTYPHPIERVWRAVSEAKELSRWYLPEWTLEPRLGGAWSCSYGNPSLAAMQGSEKGFGHGVITAWEPPRLVDYGGQHRFELEPAPGGTRLTWTQTFDPALIGAFSDVEARSRADWQARHGEEWENPGGRGYPMLPGGQAGNHWALDDLGAILDGVAPRPADDRAYYHALTDAYDDHFRRTMPPRDPMTERLASFDSRHSMRHVRVYPHPIERVFAAVSTAEHLDHWMLPHCRVEQRLGGAWAMTFGGPDLDQAVTGRIVAWEPPRLVDYGGMRFELEPLGKGATRMTFIHSFAEGHVHDPSDHPGADLPGGPDTPWRPGFVAGFHLMFDDLERWLADDLPRPELIDGAHPGHVGVHEASWLALIDVYRDHIRRTIPSR